jgi:hypothetical protein
MATAVIGAGNIGKTLTGLLSKAGEPVAIAASRVATESPSSSGERDRGDGRRRHRLFGGRYLRGVARRSTGEVRRHGAVGLIDP